MANISELQSLEQIHYKSKVKIYIYVVLVFFLFVVGFMNFFPVSDTLKNVMKTGLKGSACNPNFEDIKIEFLLPKVIISDLTLPASCLGQTGAPLKFNFLTINYHFINFSPLGLPFRIDTEMNGQPLSLYVVQGLGQRMVRLKDQSLVLSRLEPLMGGKFKISGNLTVDLNLLLTDKNLIKELTLKAQSKDLQIPSQNLQGFTTPNLKLGDLSLEANAENPPRLTVDRMIVGNPSSPLRANFNGTIDLKQEAIQFSPLNLTGEVAFSESFKESLPLIEMMFQAFTQKDGFYQIRLGGTLGAPKPSAP